MAALLALSWSALLLAEIGRFAGWLPLAVGAAVFLAMYRRLRRAGAPRSVAAAERLAVGALAVAVVAAAIPPGEVILGGADPGVYVHAAAAVARHGTLLFPAEDLAALTPEERRFVSRDQWGGIQPFPGMFVLKDGRVSPSFHHLFPSLLAVAVSLAGVWGALMVNPLLSAAAVLAVYGLARRLVPPPWHLAAPLALALNPALLWQAKFPMSELLAQVLVVAGATFLIGALDTPSPPAGVPLLAGACFGMAFLARYDTVLVLAPLVFILGVLALRRERRRVVGLVLAPLAALVAHALAHGRLFGVFYGPLPGTVARAVGAAGLALVATIAVSLTPAGRRAAAWLQGHAAALRTGAAAGLCLWAVFAWAVRPDLGGEGGDPLAVGRVLRAAGLEPLRAFLAGPERDDFIFLRDMLGAPGLAVAIAGLALLLRGASTAGRAAWALPATAVLVLFGTHVLHDHALMWVLRRFLPVAAPLLAVSCALAAAAASGLASRFGRPAGALGGAAVLAVALVPNLGASLAMARAREWPGLVSWCRSVADAVPEGAAVFSDAPGFAAPLRFLHGVRAYEHYGARRGPRQGFFRVLRQRVARGETVYFLTKRAGTEVAGLEFREQGRFPLRTSVIGTRRHGVARKPLARELDFVLYRVERGVPSPGPPGAPGAAERRAATGAAGASAGSPPPAAGVSSPASRSRLAAPGAAGGPAAPR